jgi:glutathione S-transferase
LINKYQKTKTSTVLIPSDLKKAALVDQFLSIENSYFSGPANKITKNKGGITNPEIVEEACEEISKVFDIYEKLLEGKDCIADEFSLADIFHCASMQYFIYIGHGDLLNNPERPNVSRWWKNISERECWKNTISESPLAKA